jgi:hypothetical protein
MHRAGMNPAQRDRHPPDLDRQRIAREEHAAIGQLDLRPGIKPQRAQALRFLGDKRGPVDRSDRASWPTGSSSSVTNSRCHSRAAYASRSQ